MAFKNLREMFDKLNESGEKYVVLRNWDNLPDKADLGPHGDLDLLVANKDAVVALLKGKATTSTPNRVQFKIDIGNSFQMVDVRFLGDDYYPSSWELKMLCDRIMHPQGFYIPNPQDYFWSLLYHAVIHKPTIAEDYQNKLRGMSYAMYPWLVDYLRFDRPDLLISLILGQGYNIVQPTDKTVFFNKRFVPLEFGGDIE
tara:strand:- start:349 stop:945 length:597 start_codon:yes stop_codon:yes gene_type:complete